MQNASLISVQNVLKYQWKSKEGSTLTIETLLNFSVMHMNFLHKDKANPA
jgi:hypothetical protein